VLDWMIGLKVQSFGAWNGHCVLGVHGRTSGGSRSD
jgi:hypothetical protein